MANSHVQISSHAISSIGAPGFRFERGNQILFGSLQREGICVRISLSILRSNCSCFAIKDGKEASGSGRSLRELFVSAQEPVGEKVVRLVAGATSAPLAQYISSPLTWLHSLDPRVKQAWLLALVLLPSRSNAAARLLIVVVLTAITIWTLPRRSWQDQLGRMAILSAFLFVMVALGTDGVPPLVQARTPPLQLEPLSSLPPAMGGYSYIVMKLGPLQLTRKGLSLAATASCLSFTVLQSASLCLATTTAEQLTAALGWYIKPLKYIGAPVNEVILTLLLSLRFVTLVFDEVRSLALAVVARGVQWKSLRIMETIDIFAMLFGRIFKNLFNHAEQISQAMIARGFRGASNHKFYLLANLDFKKEDACALVALASLTMFMILSVKIWN